MQASIKTRTAFKTPALTTQSLLHMLALLNSLVSSISPFIHQKNRKGSSCNSEKTVFTVEDSVWLLQPRLKAG